MKMTSTVKWFDAKKGYGFIHHPDGGADIFVHYTSIESDHRFRTLHTDEPVEFELQSGPKGVHARAVLSCDPTFQPKEDPAAPSARFQPPRPEEQVQPGIPLQSEILTDSTSSSVLH